MSLIGRRLASKAHIIEKTIYDQYLSLCGSECAHLSGYQIEKQTCGAEFILCQRCVNVQRAKEKKAAKGKSV